ncbi:anti-sigma factor [Microbacterium sp. LWH12-1.2]|uniref:anti-sigma factor n=1 Tax=Microbacterium sp. LWH12-1.2 TaxID=3135259 RepID=UPI0034205476
MNEKEFAELAAGAALHALSPEDDARFRGALAAHPEWRGIVEEDAETAASLAFALPVAPPDGIRASLLAQIAQTPQTPHGENSPTSSVPLAESPLAAPEILERRPQRRWSRAVLALAACLAVLVGLGIGAVALNQQLNRPADVIALDEIRSADDAAQASIELESGGTATAYWSDSLGAAVLVTDGIAAPSDGETYELWFVRGETPVSAGVFTVDGGDATAALQGDMHTGDVIAVTVEQAGGSPSGQPTSDPVIVIPTA